jgi:AcrR family transcriptional regulator
VTTSPVSGPQVAGPQVAARARARRGEGERLREEIIEAVERLLARTGDIDLVSIRAIADEVGVTPPSIYRHFADKFTLVQEVVARHFATLDDAIETAGRRSDDPVESLRLRGRAYVDFGLANPEHYRVLFMCKTADAPAFEDLADSAGMQAFQHLVDAVQRGIDAGAFPPDLDATLGAVTIWTALHGITSLLISMPTFPWPDVDGLLDRICATQACGLMEPAREVRS